MIYHCQLYLLTALIECLTVLLGYLDLLQVRWHSTVSIQKVTYPRDVT